MSQRRQVAIAVPVVLALLPAATALQDREHPQEVEPYYRALGEHFRVSRAEVDVLAAWGLPPDHLAVVLFLSRRAGASPDALITQRRDGLSWAEVTGPLGMDASSFYVELGRDASPGRLAAAYERFAATPKGQWPSIELRDAEIVDLVNLDFLGTALGVPPARVLEVAGPAASWVAVHGRLRGPG